MHRRQQQRQKPAHLHHLLRVGNLHAAADDNRHQVSAWFEVEALCVKVGDLEKKQLQCFFFHSQTLLFMYVSCFLLNMFVQCFFFFFAREEKTFIPK